MSYLLETENLIFRLFLLYNHKVPNKRELQQVTIHHSSGIVCQDFMKIYTKMYCKIIFFFS